LKSIGWLKGGKNVSLLLAMLPALDFVPKAKAERYMHYAKRLESPLDTPKGKLPTCCNLGAFLLLP